MTAALRRRHHVHEGYRKSARRCNRSGRRRRGCNAMRDIIRAFPRPMQPASHAIIIQGITRQGRAFRPSDWADRLCGVMAAFGGDHQMRYSPWVRPMIMDGVRCVFVKPELRQAEPRAWRFLLDFARDNELVVLDPSSPPQEDFCPVPGADITAVP
jgi:hypothetical protein